MASVTSASTTSVAERARTIASEEATICRVWGCGRPTQRAAGKGLSATLCVSHVRRQARTGSAHHASLKGFELAPYRTAARRWLRTHRSDKTTSVVVAQLDGLLTLGAGTQWHLGLKGRPPIDKARATFGRLKATGVTGEVLLEVGLAVGAMVRERGIVVPAYLFNQIARVLMRMHAPTPAMGGWRPSEASSRTSGRALGVIGRHVWFYTSIVATPQTLDGLGQKARRGAVSAARQEAKRKAEQEVRRRTADAIARRIQQARTAGYGARELVEMEATLRRQYGLKPRAEGRHQ